MFFKIVKLLHPTNGAPSGLAREGSPGPFKERLIIVIDTILVVSQFIRHICKGYMFKCVVDICPVDRGGYIPPGISHLQ